MEGPSGLCATCRYLQPELMRYTAAPWAISFSCALRGLRPANWIKAPHAASCVGYEREAGAD